MPFEPIVPEGQHLGKSSKHADAVTGHLFDENNHLQGHAAWEWVDETEPSYSSRDDDYEPPHPLTQEELEQIAQLVGLIVIGIVKAVEVTSPLVKRWWIERVRPAINSARERIKGIDKQKPEHAGSDTLSQQKPRFVVSASGTELEVAESKLTMSSGEWRARFQAMIAAGTFQERQRQMLANAQVVEDAHSLSARQETEQLTPSQFADRVQAMLMANPALLTESTVTELVRLFSSPPDSPDRLSLA